MIHTHLCIITYTVLNVPFSLLLHYIIRVFLNLSGWILNSSMTAPSRRRTNYLTLAQPCIIGRRLSTTYLGLACLLRPSPPFVATFWESLGAAMPPSTTPDVGGAVRPSTPPGARTFPSEISDDSISSGALRTYGTH